MANIEQMINYQLNKAPGVKKYIKRAYQLGCYAVSKKIKSEDNILKVSPDDPLHEYFFGYKLGLKYDFVRNGVDVDQYCLSTPEEKASVRKELGIDEDTFLYVYTGQLIERKNMHFMLDAYVKAFPNDNVQLLVLGGGAQLEELTVKYGNISNIKFIGNVMNVNRYLKAGDAYVSASKSEGLPNGVLEAMAIGLPVVLSDIEQHLEVYEANTNVGKIFKLTNMGDCSAKMKELVKSDYKQAGKEAYKSAHENFSVAKMSKEYQNLYTKIAEGRVNRGVKCNHYQPMVSSDSFYIAA